MDHQTDIRGQAKVLIIDDNESNIITIKGLLREEGYNILTALSGSSGLELAFQHLPDLILLDIKMPVMDGFEVCRQLKAGENTKNIPIIFLTVLSQTSDIVKGLNLGAEDYIPKPFKTAELLARVKTHINLKIARDEIRKNNETLSVSNQQLALLNTTKDKLLSIISHDLKAPMGTLKEILDFIMSHYSDFDHQRLRESLENIRDSIESSYTLVVNLLYWARNQRGDILFDPKMNNIKEIIEDSIRLLSASAKSKNIQLESTSQTEPIGWFDRNMMSVVVRNLTSNAIKFTNDGGKIKISVFDDRDDPQNKLLVEVKDTGVGIKDELISEIFSNGALLTTRGTGFEQGSGLGLKLCREFVERNGGKIWAESEPAVGSRFIFTLPRKAASVL